MCDKGRFVTYPFISSTNPMLNKFWVLTMVYLITGLIAHQ